MASEEIVETVAAEVELVGEGHQEEVAEAVVHPELVEVVEQKVAQRQ